MTSPRSVEAAEAAAAVLTKALTRESSLSPPDAEVRARAIAEIERAIVAKARETRRKRARMWVVSALAIAAAALSSVVFVLTHAPVGPVASTTGKGSTVLAVLHPQGDGAVVVGSNAGNSASDGETVGQGSRIVVRRQGSATLAFATGTELVLEERGDLIIEGSGALQRFALGFGSVHAKVAKLSAGQRFVIATSDAEVEVRGTSFLVSVVAANPRCGEGTTTRVDVEEGTVVVRHGGREVNVHAGGHWPAECNDTSPVPPSVAASASSDRGAPKGVLIAPTGTSHLGDMNDSFAEALAAKRAGASGRALMLFDRFLATYPGSPLAESAMGERLKLLHTKAAAREYLGRYPSGMASAEARTILAEEP